MKATYKSHCARDIATRPDLPKQCCTVAWKESVPLSFEFMTMSRIVQSTTMVRPISRAVPVTRPALRTAYGWPMMPAPLLQVSCCLSSLPLYASHNAVCHVQKGALHSAARPRALQMIFWVEVFLRDCYAWRLNAREQRQPLCSFPTSMVHVVIPVQLYPVSAGVGIPIHAPSRLFEADSIRGPRCAIGAVLGKGRLPLDTAIWM